MIRNRSEQPIAKARVENTRAIIFGTRPFFAGTKATHRQGSIKFFPWLVADVNQQDGTFSVTLLGTKQLRLWYSEHVRSKTIQIRSDVDDSIASSICFEEDGPIITTAPGIDPAVMISLAMILIEFQNKLR
jgi:hypothetical protein